MIHLFLLYLVIAQLWNSTLFVNSVDAPTEPAMVITFPRHVPTCETRRYRVQHHGRQDYMIEVEVADAAAVQMQFGSQFNFQRSGHHGHWQQLNSSTVFLRQIRYKGADAAFKHTLIFFKDTSPGQAPDTWRCTSFPMVMIMIPHGDPPEWSRTTSEVADLTQEAFTEYLLSSSTSSSSSSSDEHRTSSSTSSSSASHASSFVSSETSWTWLDFQQHTHPGPSYEEPMALDALSETYHVPM